MLNLKQEAKTVSIKYNANLQYTHEQSEDESYVHFHFENAKENSVFIVEEFSKFLSSLDIRFEMNYNVINLDGSLDWGYAHPIFKLQVFQ